MKINFFLAASTNNTASPLKVVIHILKGFHESKLGQLYMYIVCCEVWIIEVIFLLLLCTDWRFHYWKFSNFSALLCSSLPHVAVAGLTDLCCCGSNQVMT